MSFVEIATLPLLLLVPGAAPLVTFIFFVICFILLFLKSADKLYWSAEDAAKLGHLAARANDILATAQTFITTMVRPITCVQYIVQ